MKILVGFITTGVTAAMLTVGFSAPAQAACETYAPCIDTQLNAWSAKNPIRARQGASFRVRLVADDGRKPDARIRYSVVRRSNGNVVDRGRRFYNGGRETYTTDPLGRGRYRIIVIANPVNDRYNRSSAVFGQRVKRR